MSTESTDAPVQTADNVPAVDAAEPQQTLAGAAREWWVGVRYGELGALPIGVGIVVDAI